MKDYTPTFRAAVLSAKLNAMPGDSYANGVNAVVDAVLEDAAKELEALEAQGAFRMDTSVAWLRSMKHAN